MRSTGSKRNWIGSRWPPGATADRCVTRSTRGEGAQARACAFIGRVIEARRRRLADHCSDERIQSLDVLLRNRNEYGRSHREVGEHDSTALAAEHLLDTCDTLGNEDGPGRIAESHDVLVTGRWAVFDRAEVGQAAHVRGRNPLRKPGYALSQ